MALRAVDAESVTVDATSGGVAITTAKITSGVVRAFCKVETAEIRIQTDPDITITAGGSEGSPIMAVGSSFFIHGQPDIKNFRAIRTSGVSGVLRVILEGATRVD